MQRCFTIDIFHVGDNTILEKSCDMPTGRNNLLSVKLFCKDETERWTAQSFGRTVSSWSQKESLKHQEEKYAVRHHCIIRAMKLPCFWIDVIIDPLRLACINVRLRVVA